MVVLPLLWACGESATAVRVNLDYDASWSMTSVEVALGAQRSRGALAPSLYVRLPDDWSGRSETVRVWGHRDGEAIAHGTAVATIEPGRVTEVGITLLRLPCGAWCEPGATSCAFERHDRDVRIRPVSA